MKVAIFFFSATGNTKAVAEFIAEELKQHEVKVEFHDITSFSSREQEYFLEGYDGVLFGFPVYAWRAPSPMRTWLANLEGKEARCATFFTYGGISMGAAHHDTISILKESGFKVLGSLEVISSHTFNLAGWGILENRPNESDKRLARSFAKQILIKFEDEGVKELDLGPSEISEKVLKRLDKTSKKGVPLPKKKTETCSMCMTCEEVCPTKAMDAEVGIPQDDQCIRCLCCLVNCPDDVIDILDMAKQKQFILKANHLTELEIKEKKSKMLI